MKIGLSYDLKETVGLGLYSPEDALEEYDSLETVEAIEAAIKAQGHSVVRLGGGRDFLSNILQEEIDFVFNIAEGRGAYRSREAQVPSILEMLDIPYSGSDPQTLAICLDKPLTKKLAATAGVGTPGWRVITDHHDPVEICWDAFRFPAFVKPACEGSSKGIRFGSLAEDAEQTAQVAADLLERYHQPILVEEFVDGDEITVGIVGNPPRILGIMRVLSKKRDGYFIYSLEVKREWEDMVDYECPARLEDSVTQEIKDSSLKIFEVLGCRDSARIDFRLGPEGTPYFLEINPLPGLNPRSSDLPIMAGKMGWPYEDLISTVLDAGLERYPQCVQR